VAKYSKASIVNIELNRSENKLILAIIDNGTGFDTTTQPSGNGLSNMKSRAEAISGNLSIESAPGNGTCIMLTCLT
jgi:signal transduction histidine kinase